MAYNISIGIPCFNSELYLEQCLDSVLRQKGEDIARNKVEILCVNDGSTDRYTRKILKEYENKYNNVKVFEHSRNRGVSAARNTIIENSQGKEILFLDSDDYLRGEYHLATLYDIACSDPNIGLVSGSMLKQSEDKGIYLPEKWMNYQPEDMVKFEGKQSTLLWSDLYISSCNKLFDGQTVRENVRFDTNYTYFEDAKFVTDYVIKMPYQVAVYTPDAKYIYRKHAGSAINKLNSSERRMRIVEFHTNQICYYLGLLENTRKAFGISSVAYKMILERSLKSFGAMRSVKMKSEHTRFIMNAILDKIPTQQCLECRNACFEGCENFKTLDSCLTKAKSVLMTREK